MKALVSLVAAAAAAATIAPVAARSLSTAKDHAARADLELLANNAQLFAIQNGRWDVSLEDFEQASRYASYRAEDWPMKPRYDPATQRFFANPRGGECFALELREASAPDGSVTAPISVVVERPQQECDEIFSDLPSMKSVLQPAGELTDP
jgi:hypothetical protein